jgi:hypothetical protein
MRNLIFILSISLLLSCAGNKEAEKIKLPELSLKKELIVQEHVLGDLKDYLSIIKSYNGEEMQYTIEVSKKHVVNDTSQVEYLIKSELSFFLIGSKNISAGVGYNHYGPTLSLDLLDDKGNIIEFNGWNSKIDMVESMEDFSKMLIGQEIETDGSNQISLKFERNYPSYMFNDTSELNNFIKDVKRINGVRVNSEIIAEKQDSKSSNEETSKQSDNSSSSSSSSDCDKFLMGYEKYVDDYIAILKEQKADPTNMKIISKVAKITEESKNWASKMEDCKNDPQFLSKYTELQQKILKSASSLN